MRRLLKLNRVGSLKSLLLYWVLGSGIALVVIYSSVVEFKFRFGVQMVLGAHLEWYSEHYENAYEQDKSAPLPSRLGLYSYRSIDEMPIPLRMLIKNRVLQKGGYQDRKIEFFLEHDYTGEFVAEAFKDETLCDVKVCDIMFFFPYQLRNGEWLYLVQGLPGNEKLYEENDLSEYLSVGLSLAVLLSIGAIAWLLVKKVSMPVEELANWAKQLSGDEQTPPPDFKYKELNQVADQLKQALKEIRASVDKEHQFLQQASHELRTPLAIASGNIDILNLIGESKQQTEGEANAMGRLSHAINDMTQLTETILWLNRDLESLPELTTIDLLKLTKNVVADNQYLLAGKQVTVEVIGQCKSLESSQILCSIVLSNLIRNAFQHTFEGKVFITINSSQLEIRNENVSKTKGSGTEVYGFGLGLVLVEQIASRMQWNYQCYELETGWLSSVDFDI